MGAIAIGGNVQRGAAGVGWWAMSGVGWRRCNINASGGVIPKISHNLEPRGGGRNIVNNPDADFIKPGPDFFKPEPDFKKSGPGFLKCVWSPENDQRSCGNNNIKYCGCKKLGVQGHAAAMVVRFIFS
jgi:hypothetical protein